MKKALITGITGQDGSYLADLLIEKGYEVYGIIRRASSFNTQRIDHLYVDPHIEGGKLKLVYGDLSDANVVAKIIREIQPDEVYNLAAQSHVRVSFDIPAYTADIVAVGTLRVLEALKDFCPDAKFYQASSSEMYSKVHEVPLKETTPFHPRSPYACSKVFGYWVTVNYREAYNMFACNGILFNHESPRRGETFVTRKITRAVARIKAGRQDKLYLGNLDAKRDWGYARDYVKAMWQMLQQDKPDDYVIATREAHTVREFLEKAFRHAGFNIKSNGKQGIKEKYIDKNTGKTVVEIDPKYFRPAENYLLLGDYTKAYKKFGWKPKVKFHDLIKLMVDADIKLLEADKKEARIEL
jgi:GDPmannose 4,6-dehydratase